MKKSPINYFVLYLNLLTSLPITAQQRIPSIEKGLVRFQNKTIKFDKNGDHAFMLRKWGKIVLIKTKLPELVLSMFDFDGNKIAPDRAVLGRIFILENTERIVLAYANNEFDNQNSLLINKNNEVIKSIKINEPIVDWFHSNDGKLFWVFTPNERDMYSFVCQVFDYKGNFVDKQNVKPGYDFKLSYDNIDYVIHVNIKTVE